MCRMRIALENADRSLMDAEDSLLAHRAELEIPVMQTTSASAHPNPTLRHAVQELAVLLKMVAEDLSPVELALQTKLAPRAESANASAVAHAILNSALRTVTSAEVSLIPLAVQQEIADLAQQTKLAIMAVANAFQAKIALLFNAVMLLYRMDAEASFNALKELAQEIKIA